MNQTLLDLQATIDAAAERGKSWRCGLLLRRSADMVIQQSQQGLGCFDYYGGGIPDNADDASCHYLHFGEQDAHIDGLGDCFSGKTARPARSCLRG